MKVISRKIGLWWLRNEGIAESQYPIVIYGIELFLNTTLKVVGILAAGAILGMFAEVLLAMTAFCGMRYWTGGYHCKTHIGCFSVMALVCLGAALVSKINFEGAVKEKDCFRLSNRNINVLHINGVCTNERFYFSYGREL